MIPTLLPAYGRDYKSKAAIADDLNNNKDFIISGLNLTYANKDQLITENFKSIVVSGMIPFLGLLCLSI